MYSGWKGFSTFIDFSSYEDISKHEQVFDPTILQKLGFNFDYNNAGQLAQFRGSTVARGLAMHPDIAVDPNGNIHVVWQDNRDGNYEIYYARKLYGKGWESSGFGGQDIRITKAEGDSLNPSIAADEKGKLHIVWQDNRNAR